MSSYIVEGNKGEDCHIFNDARFGEIRTVIDDDGSKLFAGIDLASCMGFDAPTKAVNRSKIKGKMKYVPWISGKRKGCSETRCFTLKEAEAFIKNGLMPPKGFEDWFKNEVAVQDKQEPSEEVKTSQKTVSEDRSPVGKEKNLAEVFSRIDEIILEMMMLKKELAGRK